MPTRPTRGWLMAQVTTVMSDIGGWAPGIASGDTELDDRDIILIIDYFSIRLERTIKWKPPTKQGRFTISTFLDHLEIILDTPPS